MTVEADFKVWQAGQSYRFIHIGKHAIAVGHISYIYFGGREGKQTIEISMVGASAENYIHLEGDDADTFLDWWNDLDDVLFLS